jgi:ribosomal protein S18 acetylase RimI-like enzyme
MKIRLAQPKDIDTIAKNNNLMAQETEGKELDMQTVTQGVKAIFDDHSKGFYLVVEIDDEIAANLMITYEWSDWRNSNIWWIQSVYVVKEHRRKGLYKAMYNDIKNRAKLEGVKVIRLYVEEENTIAQQTYKSLGMQHSYYYMFEADI